MMENTTLLSSEDNIGSSGKKECLWDMSSCLQKKILIFFAILILMASILCGVTIYHHNKGEADFSQVTGLTDNQANSSAQDHGGLEDSLIIMTSIMIGVLVAFMFFFIRKFIKPLNQLEHFTREMADGRLDLLVQDSPKASCAISAIGENVNSIAMNLQEVLLLNWNLSAHNLGNVEETLKLLNGDSEIPREQILASLLSLKGELQQMQDLTQQFEFFDVTLQGKKALAKDETTN